MDSHIFILNMILEGRNPITSLGLRHAKRLTKNDYGVMLNIGFLGGERVLLSSIILVS